VPYAIDFDTAPGFWLKGHPANASAPLRKLEGALAHVTALGRDLTTSSRAPLFNFFVDEPGLKALHMITADPDRTPGVVGFGEENHFILTSPLINGGAKPEPTSTCNHFPAATDANCVSNAFIWLHGDFAEDIDHTWAGFAGPGVRRGGVDGTTWADHADLRPTMMTLLCLKDSYAYEGRALLEDIQDSALPPSVAQHRQQLINLGRVYKQLNAPVGDFGVGIINLSTLAIKSNDATYNRLEALITAVTDQRDTLVTQIQAELDSVPGCGGLSREDNSLHGRGQSMLATTGASISRELRGR
jgi:hypothetical protein